MPFEAYLAYFRPEALGILAAAYDAAWQDLWTERLTLGAEQTSVLKKNLAQIILASACTGKRDVERLKEIALLGVSSRLLHKLGMLLPQLLPGALLAA